MVLVLQGIAQCCTPAEILVISLESLVQKYRQAMITFSVCIFLFSSTSQLLRPPPGNSHCPGLQSEVGAWAGKEGQQSWDGGRKTGWCLERWDYINSGVNEKPKSSTHYLATTQLKAATTNPRVWDTHETMRDLQRHRMDLENSNDPACRAGLGLSLS